ncbi:MAG TPA: hypothetical protein VNA44_08000, partial [Burkholderiaceae bacterium]|nr:hypothetical protein [Burkholderiaceae bacterium]
EVWLSSSGREVLAIVSIDGASIGTGQPGPMYRKMHTWFQQAKVEDARAWSAQRGMYSMESRAGERIA